MDSGFRGRHPRGVLPTSCPSLCWGQEPGEGAGTTPQRKKHLSTWGPAWWLGILLQPNLVARKEERGGSQGLSLVHRLFRKREHNKYTDPFLKKKKKCFKCIISLKISSVFHNV